jgi:UDP-N-acetylmuramate: L-alanyl-gamma-D-glutamyl-meso-diaminopimelate ligase
MKVHILGVCGTFMGGIAILAKELGFKKVSGSDAQVYPPMSTQLEGMGITLREGYQPAHLNPAPDQVIVGNALSRGNPAIEYMLDQGIPYVSGPQWLAEQVLSKRSVLAVSGTHGKTTTASLLAWILEAAGLQPGFLIGGVPQNFGVSARLGRGPLFVVEADEYDTAFFDKRSKFVHYRPKTLIINNIEFDHADIFPDLEAIKRQFHHLVRTVPGQGRIIRPRPDPVIDQVLAMGCWTPQVTFGEGENAEWCMHPSTADYHRFEIWRDNQPTAKVAWSLIGRHNAHNALAAIAAASHAGVEPPHIACQALAQFKNVKRRLEPIGLVDGITVYDDFAHHPTAIHATLEALRQHLGPARIIALFEPRSNTLRLGAHREELASAFTPADLALLYSPPDLDWDLLRHTASLGEKRRVFKALDALIDHVVAISRSGDHILIMSNGGFGGIHHRIVRALQQR